MKDEIHPNNLELALCIIFHCICGVLLAVGYHLTFQLPVEDARVMSGFVEYPKNNVYFLLHANAWSLMNQLGAAALQNGVTEETLNISFCALGGALSLTSLGLLSLSWSKNLIISLFIPLFIYSFGLVGLPSANYPIYLMGTMYTQGIIGLFFGLLSVGLISCGRLKTAAFLTGVAVSVHPTLGAFYLISFIVFIFFTRKSLESKGLTSILQTLSIGILISACSLLAQKLYYAATPPVTDTETVKLLLHKCLQNFSWHRSPASKKWLSASTGVALLPALVAIVALRREHFAKKTKYAATILISLTITAFFLITVDSAVDSDYFNLFMSWRYLNILNLCCFPVAMGLLGRSGHSRHWQGIALLTALVVIVVLTREGKPAAIYPIAATSAIWMLLARKATITTEKLQWTTITTAGMLLTAAFALIITPAARNLLEGTYDKSIYDNYKNNIEYEILSNRPNLLLISSDSGLVQSRIKRPILIGPHDLESHIYLPKTLPQFNYILNKVYGLDLMTAQPNSVIHNTWMTREHRTLWEARTIAEWRKIKEEFGVTDVLTSPEWDLKLPLVMRTETFSLYEIR